MILAKPYKYSFGIPLIKAQVYCKKIFQVKFIEWFSMECRKTKYKPITYCTCINLYYSAKSQTIVKPEPNPDYLQNSIENNFLLAGLKFICQVSMLQLIIW